MYDYAYGCRARIASGGTIHIDDKTAVGTDHWCILPLDFGRRAVTGAVHKLASPGRVLGRSYRTERDPLLWLG